MRLYDTARREIVPFEPGRVVTMYTCGITPYDSAHLGHAATYLTYDVLQRRLRDIGYETCCVRNVTDVDDDILRKARQLGVHYLDLATEEMASFIGRDGGPGPAAGGDRARATSAIPDILGFIGMVLGSGHAYQAGGAVYFDVSSLPRFGWVSHYGRDEMLELAGEHGGRPDDPNKRDPLDFVLWQPSLAGRAGLGLAVGPGRPGWHIECSALVIRELGRHDRPPRRRDRPDLPPPRVRGGAVGGGDRASRSSGTGCTSGMVGTGGDEDVEVARQPRLRPRPARSSWEPAACGWPSSTTTTAPSWTGRNGSSRRRTVRLAAWRPGRPGRRRARRGAGPAGRRPRHTRRAAGHRRPPPGRATGVSRAAALLGVEP